MALISTGLRIVGEGTITLPVGLAKTMYNIYHTMPERHRGDEFGLYLKGEWDEQEATVHVVEDLYYMPVQTVSAGFIRFDEEPPDPSWNVVIHRHPRNVTRFSGEDRNSINQEFLASMLFIPEWEFPDAIINVPVSHSLKVQIPAKVKVIGGFFDGLEPLMEQAGQRIRHGTFQGKGGALPPGLQVPRPAAKIGQTSEFADGGSCEVVGEADPAAAAQERPGETLARAAKGGGLRPLGQTRHGRRQAPDVRSNLGELTEEDLREIGLRIGGGRIGDETDDDFRRRSEGYLV